MFAIRPSRQQMYADDPKFLWKYILRSLSVILAIISIGLIGWSLANQVSVINDIYTDFGYAYYDSPYNNDFWFLPWEIISLGLSVVWNITNILVLLTRNRPVHPGANVACDLLLWLALMATGTLATLGGETYFWWYPTAYDSYNDITGPYDTSSSSSSASNSAVNQTGVVVALVGTAIGFVVLLMHFALFVSACRYTHARRRTRRVDGEAALIAQRMFDEKVGRDVAAAEERNPNAGFVAISEPVEQQAPLDYGMPPAPTGMTVGDQGKRRAGMGEEVEEGRVKGTRYSYEQPEVVGGGGEGPGDGRAGVPVYRGDVYEA